MKAIPVADAIGMVLGHDVTRIVPGKEKGTAFKKGLIIREEEILAFLDMGKENIFVLDMGPGIRFTSPANGKVNLIAETGGLLNIDVSALARVNSIGQSVFATRYLLHQEVAGTRVVPLVKEEKEIVEAERICGEVFPLIQIKPF